MSQFISPKTDYISILLDCRYGNLKERLKVSRNVMLRLLKVYGNMREE